MRIATLAGRRDNAEKIVRAENRCFPLMRIYQGDKRLEPPKRKSYEQLEVFSNSAYNSVDGIILPFLSDHRVVRRVQAPFDAHRRAPDPYANPGTPPTFQVGVPASQQVTLSLANRHVGGSFGAVRCQDRQVATYPRGFPELLELSKVCSRWHRVVLGTPRLWSDIAMDLDYWADLSEATSFLNFLRTFLERGAHHPLTISLIIDNGNTLEHEHCVSALTLVAEHSQRWKHMYYRGPLSGLDHISHIKEKLDILETLSHQTWEEETLADLFEVAPRLTRVSVHLENAQLCPKLPWDQLHSFTCIGAHSEEISYITGLMRNLSHFRKPPSNSAASTVTSTIYSFLIELWPSVDPDLDEIFDCLTLTHLQKLFIVPVGATKAHIPWPVDHFESLSFRSSFCDTLRVLEIPAVDITEDELLSSLASLGSLDRLVVSDQLEFGDLPEHVLITDTLLLRLTHPSHLVPNLKTFMCTSLYQFSADVYFDFAVSRIAAGEGPFQYSLRKFRKTSYESDPGVHQKLIELVDKGELEFSVGEEEVS
ncbi:hypothetical protein C8R43DRAFT_1150797 [Mycena crocata]|nr:hypothetical protein C8R43DRAFT_1150797 [Mycena crocata]